MKKIEATVRHWGLDQVKEALTSSGVHGMTVSEVKACDGQNGHAEVYRGTPYNVDFHPRIKIELAVTDDQLTAVVEALEHCTRTHQCVDETILVMPLEDCVRIRTGEHVGTTAHAADRVHDDTRRRSAMSAAA